MKELIERWKSETPLFWKKIRNIAITLAISAISIREVNTYLVLDLPTLLIEICNYTIAVGAALGGAAQLTKKDNTLNQ